MFSKHFRKLKSKLFPKTNRRSRPAALPSVITYMCRNSQKFLKNSSAICKIRTAKFKDAKPPSYLHSIFAILQFEISSLFQTWILQATAGRKTQFKLRKKSSSSNFIFQTGKLQKSSADRYEERTTYYTKEKKKFRALGMVVLWRFSTSSVGILSLASEQQMMHPICFDELFWIPTCVNYVHDLPSFCRYLPVMKEFTGTASVRLAELEDLFVDMKARVSLWSFQAEFIATMAGFSTFVQKLWGIFGSKSVKI